MKKVYIPYTIKSCRDCIYGRNTARDHDDPFTSFPIPVWYCTSSINKGVNENFIIQNPFIIDKKCPLY